MIEIAYIRSERDAGEITLEEFRVAGPVGGGVEDRVNVIENVFRSEGLFQVALAIRDEGKPERFSMSCNESGLRLGLPLVSALGHVATRIPSPALFLNSVPV